MRTKKVGEIMAVLPSSTQEIILTILNRDEDDSAKVVKLKAILRLHETELEQIGIVPDYLAYALIYVGFKARRVKSWSETISKTQFVGLDCSFGRCCPFGNSGSTTKASQGCVGAALAGRYFNSGKVKLL